MKERGIFLKRFRKVLIVLLAILVPVSIGFGFNFFSWNGSKESAENQAMTVAGTLTVNQISESQNLVPQDKICNGVTMDITSSAVSLLRVKVDIYCEDSETAETDIAPIKNAGNNWLKGSDGYTFTSGTKMTGALIQMGGVPKTMTVDQAKHGVFAEKWGLSENKDGDIYTKLKKISNDQGQ